MPYRRLIALVLDLLAVAAGGGAGLLLAVLAVESRNTIGSMGNIVIAFMLVAAGCAVAWGALVATVTIAGRSPGQRIMGLRYEPSCGPARRLGHYLLAWLVPAVLAVAPALTLDALGTYRDATLERWEAETGWKRRHDDLSRQRSDLEYAYRSGALQGSLTEADYAGRMQDYDRTIENLQRERAGAVRWLPGWIGEIDGIVWLLLVSGPVFLYALASLALLFRPPHAAVHDRMTGVRIVAGGG